MYLFLSVGVLLFCVLYRTSTYGGVEQLVDCKAHNLEVVGSNLASATMETNPLEILSSLVWFAF